jgi:Condensation domain
MTTNLYLDPQNIDDIIPLSDIQKGMVFYSLKKADELRYYNQTYIQIKNVPFDEQRVRQALSLLVEKHHLLRTGYNMSQFEEPVQMVLKQIPLPISHLDKRGLDVEKHNSLLRELMIEDRQKPFSFENREPLWRLRTIAITDDHFWLMWLFHHSIIDGWSFASLMTELKYLYGRLALEPDFVPKKLAVSYKDFVIDQIAEKRKQENIDFWRNELTGYKRFNFAGLFNHASGPQGKRGFPFDLGHVLVQDLRLATKIYNTDLRCLCLAAFAYVLNLFSQDNEILSGLVVNNRPIHEDGDKIIGCFLNSIPVRLPILSDVKWREYIALIDKKLIRLKQFERVSLFEIVRIIGEKFKDENPFFDVSFNLVDFHIYNSNTPQDKENRGSDENKQNDESYSMDTTGDVNVMLDCLLDATGDKFMVNFTYEQSVLSKEIVKKVAEYFRFILGKIASEPDGIVNREDFVRSLEVSGSIDDLLAPKPRELDIDFNF